VGSQFFERLESAIADVFVAMAAARVSRDLIISISAPGQEVKLLFCEAQDFQGVLAIA
jgi:hypothetical protein